jgi:FKBP-type peptidyl-prolyl cis-trans isomerase
VKGERLLGVACCVLATALVGCGGSSGSTAHTGTTATRSQTSVAESGSTQEQHGAASAEARAPTRRGSGFAPNPYREPGTPGPHPGAKVDRVIVHDIKIGRGTAVRPGDSVWADYIAANYTTGHKFLRAWGHGPFGTENMGLVSPNWMRGLIIGMTGMRPGGRRTILVPRRLSDLADADRAGNSYHEIVYWDVVLREVDPRPTG